jgi:hypothetical protein
MQPQLSAAIRRVLAQSPPQEPRWTVCVKGEHQEVLATIALGSHKQVSALALELDRLGYKSVADDPDPCDFVFSLQLAHA